MELQPAKITSIHNARIKEVVRLRKRSSRDESGLILIEGYREVLRALDNRVRMKTLFFCRELFLGSNEDPLMTRCDAANIELIECGEEAFRKMAYRDRPDGLLALATHTPLALDDLDLPDRALLLIAEHIEKPGNLGTMLRAADGAGAHAVIVCDRCTDLSNPNVVRASIGTLFALPVVESSSAETRAWLSRHGFTVISATPHAETNYTEADYGERAAIVVGAEQYGLSEAWMEGPVVRVRIPMLGQSDSLNVGTAAAILLYEAVRQRTGKK